MKNVLATLLVSLVAGSAFAADPAPAPAATPEEKAAQCQTLCKGDAACEKLHPEVCEVKK